MRPACTRLLFPAAGALIALGCEPTINVALKIVQPCDQPDALDGVGTFRFEVTGTDTKSMASNFSRAKKNGQVPNLPLGEDVKVTVKGFTGDVEKDPAVVNAAAVASGASQPRDLLATTTQRDVEIAVPVGRVDTFASTTNVEKKECSAMSTPRHGHTATYMPKIGKVLIVGGAVLGNDGKENLIGTAELYDPATGEFSELPEPPGGPRIYHAASALPDGRVLVTGGLSIINEVVQTVAHGFVYDPGKSKDPYTLVTMPSGHARAHHTSTLVDTGSLVLLVGGCSNKSGQVCTRSSANNAFKTTLIFDIAAFDKGSATLAPGPDLPNNDPGRVFHVALPVAGGKVLVAGGSSGGANPVCSLLLFDAVQRDWTAGLGDTLTSDACTSHLAGAALADGRILINGGYKVLTADGAPTPNASDRSKSTTIWNPNETSRLSGSADLIDGRAEHVLFGLAIGTQAVGAVAVGGVTGSSAPAERLNIDASTWTATVTAPVSLRLAMGAVALGSGQPLLLGGIDPASGTGTTVDVGELYFMPDL